MATITHMYHLVDKSPWPLFSGLGAWMLTSGLVGLFMGMGSFLMVFGLLFLFLVVFQWWRDIVREGMYLGLHGNFVVMGLKYGIVTCSTMKFKWPGLMKEKIKLTSSANLN